MIKGGFCQKALLVCIKDIMYAPCDSDQKYTFRSRSMAPSIDGPSRCLDGDEHAVAGPTDVWRDEPVMSYIKHGSIAADAPAHEKL